MASTAKTKKSTLKTRRLHSVQGLIEAYARGDYGNAQLHVDRRCASLEVIKDGQIHTVFLMDKAKFLRGLCKAVGLNAHVDNDPPLTDEEINDMCIY
jgi:hypothetical protein